jgi:hypothetical protein
MEEKFVIIEVDNAYAELFRQVLFELKFPPGKQKVGSVITKFKVFYEDAYDMYKLGFTFQSRWLQESQIPRQ